MIRLFSRRQIDSQIYLSMDRWIERQICRQRDRWISIGNAERYTGCSLNIVFFSKILKYIPDSDPYACTTKWQVEHQRRSITGRVEEKTQYLMNTLYYVLIFCNNNSPVGFLLIYSHFYILFSPPPSQPPSSRQRSVSSRQKSLGWCTPLCRGSLFQHKIPSNEKNIDPTIIIECLYIESA